MEDKENIENEEIEVNISYTDITMCETDGDFKKTCKLMLEEGVAKEWMIRTTLTIDSIYGLAVFVLNLHSNGVIYIVNYSPSVGDVYYNPDIQSLVVWASEKGWDYVEPSEYQVRDNPDFWRHYWRTNLIKSELLQKLFGDRE